MNIVQNGETNIIKNLNEVNEAVSDIYNNEAVYYNNTIINCSNAITCPECGARLFPDSGCMCCKLCGFSACTIA